MTTRVRQGAILGENLPGNLIAAWIADALLAWYDAERRELPWRASPGASADPYKVWLSEVMLQQTTVKAVAPYYSEFLTRWPSVEALAAADLEDVLRAWAGLGYYARARNLHACARTVAGNHGGRFPETERGLLKLPGVGAYTAAAIAAIAFDRQAAVVDGNVERVLARYCAVRTPMPEAKKELRVLATRIAPAYRAGDFAQAMMDLGATVCTPRTPSCGCCPLESRCQARSKGLEAALPYRAAKTDRPVRRGAAFFVLRGDGAVLLRKRPSNGLLGGMTEVPGTHWVEAGAPAAPDPLQLAPVNCRWRVLSGVVRHTFTHFHLELSVYSARVGQDALLTQSARPQDCMWVPRRDLHSHALPSVMRKVVAHALDRASD